MKQTFSCLLVLGLLFGAAGCTGDEEMCPEADSNAAEESDDCDDQQVTPLERDDDDEDDEKGV